MLIYIIKFSACLAILLIFYKVVLEKSSAHNFKRFYLLGALAIALLIPTITFIEYIDPIVLERFDLGPMTTFEVIEPLSQELPINYTPIILWSIYGLGVIIFLLKFCLNLYRIVSRIKNNPKCKSQNFINVLVTNLMIPHTFFSYIFLNKFKFENDEIPKEVLLHEQTHAYQKHSIDVLLLEILQIIFWFNPLIYVLKRDIKLNHEFQADRAVLQNGIQPSAYQELLLAFSSNASEPQLANAINYSSIKKRFTVMNTHTSKQSIWLRSLLLLPVIAILFYSFTERKQVEKEIITPEVIELYLNENEELILEDEVITLDDIEVFFQNNAKLQVSIKVFPDANPKISKNLTLKLREIGIKKMTICTSRVAEFENNNQQEATPKQLAEYNQLAKQYNSQPKDKRVIKRSELERLQYIYTLMSDSQKELAQPFPDNPPPPPAPKHLKNDPVPSVINNIKDPIAPPLPPKAVIGEHTGFIKINSVLHYYVTINGATKFYNRKGFQVSKEGKILSATQVNASDVIPNQYITKIYSDNKIVAEFKDNKPNTKNSIVDIPPPPVEPLDFVIDMAKKDAKFYFENKEITSDKAISLLKQNRELNALTKQTKGKQPLVYLSKEPIGNKPQKSKELVKINGKTPVDNALILRKYDFKKLELTLNDAEVTSFKFKIAGKPTESIKGHTLNTISKKYIEAISAGSAVQFFDVKDSKGFVHPPVVVQISGKLVGVKGN